MYIEYDKEVDGAYIWLVDDIEKERNKYDAEIWPKELNDEIGLLFTDDQKLLGFEILSASKYLLPNLIASSIPTGKKNRSNHTDSSTLNDWRNDLSNNAIGPI